MARPLELLGGRGTADTGRVRFNSGGMRTHEITAKLQAFSLNPLVTQVVIDALPDLMLTGRKDLARKNQLRPEPIAYLRLGTENLTDALKFLKLAFVDYLLISASGHVASTEALSLEVEEVAKQLKNEIAFAAQTALKEISSAREGILEPAQ